MSHRQGIGAFTRTRVGAPVRKATAKQQIQDELRLTPYSQAAPGPVRQVAEPAQELASMSEAELYDTLGQLAVKARAQNAVDDYQKILSEAHSLEGNAAFTFSFRSADAKPIDDVSSTSTSKSKIQANADGTPDAPAAVTFSKAALDRMFGRRAEMSEEQTLLSAYITEIHSTAPVPLSFRLDNVQGGSIDREVTNDDEPSTFIIQPGHVWSGTLPIYKLRGVDAAQLKEHGNTDLSNEALKMRDIGEGMWSVPANTKIGKIIKKNAADLAREGIEIEYIKKANAYLVDELVVGEIMEKYKGEVLDGLKKTDFSAVRGTLTRADRVASDGRAFADFSDAPGIGNKAQLRAATDAKHAVTIKVRFHIVDPSLLQDESFDDEQ